MALSQLQCLDNNHVNWRSSETKPEFFYSEEQRLALEALVSSGQDAFYEVVKKENIRDFLSELEVTKIVNRLEAFDPDSSHLRNSGEGDGDLEDGVEHSLEYWPDRSDCSIPELDLGWPDTVAYRGVTRATVYMQPPIDGQPHIKEVVRKMVTQAQKVSTCSAACGSNLPGCTIGYRHGLASCPWLMGNLALVASANRDDQHQEGWPTLSCTMVPMGYLPPSVDTVCTYSP